MLGETRSAGAVTITGVATFETEAVVLRGIR
jgi:hypothetical protein